MAGLTPRFEFNYFGGTTAGAMNDDGQKYTGLDRLTIDRLLASVETHDHKYRASDAGALDAPTVELVVDAGALQAGYTYYYRYAVVDAQGNESIASAEATLVTPDPLPLPAMVTLSVDATVGVLTPGLYYYALTAVRGAEESPIGAAALTALQAGETSVLVELPAFGDAESFWIWRMGSTEPGYTRILLIDAGGATSYVDAGAVPADPCSCDPGNVPPRSNTGISSYGATVTLPVDVDLATAQSWRLYRTVYPGVYASASLVHEVVEREDEWDPLSALLTVWTDVGGRATSGKPMDSDLNMRFQTFTFDTAAVLPDPTGYPAGYPMLVGGVLYALLDGAWVAVSAPGGGGSPIMTDNDGLRHVLYVNTDGSVDTIPTAYPGPPGAPSSLGVS